MSPPIGIPLPMPIWFTQEHLNYSNGSKQWPIVYDIANNMRVSSTLAATNLKIIFPSTTSEKEIYMADTTEINYVGLKPVTMLNINVAANYSYLIITHEKFLTQANDYKAYNATRYENFNTLVVTSDQLYDAFYYGLHHPLLRLYARECNHCT